MSFSNVIDAISWLEKQPRFKDKVDLNYLKNAFNELNIDFENTKKIHVLGTNGKGSTTAFLTNVLLGNNLKVGTFTSPYLVNFNERIRLNNQEISDELLLEYINYFYDYNSNLEIKLSFFELLTLLSFKYFSDQKTAVIVIEAGIGGRLDATNILNYDVTIVTSVGYDHMEKLGNTLEAIANEKIQALKPNGYLVSAVDGSLKTQFIGYANSIKAKYSFIKNRNIFAITPLSFYYGSKLFEVGLLGDYQRQNALLAYETVKYLYQYNDDEILPYLKTTKWAGRFEEIFPDVYIDGAHNTHAIEALMRNINYIFKDKEIIILFSALKDKQIAEMLEIIKKYPYKIILTSFPDFRFAPLNVFSDNNIEYHENGYETLLELVNNKKADQIIIATGSLHFIGYLKQQLNLHK